MGSRARASARRAALLLLTCAGSACDIPTSAPSWDTRWILDAFETDFGVEELLPPEVVITPDRTAFLVDVPGASSSASLRSICPPCAVVHGLVAPKPPFQTTLSGSSPLSGEVRAVEIAGGALVLEITNGFGFDPIRPEGGEPGSLGLTVRGGDGVGHLVAQHVLSGDVDAIPPGAVTRWTIPLLPGTVERAMRFEARLDSPRGDPVRIDADATFGIAVAFEDLQIASVRIAMSPRDVSFDPMEIDTGDVEEDLVGRVEGGAIEVRVDNPFAIELDLALVIEGPETPAIERSVLVALAGSTSRIELSGDEIRSILGRPGVVLTSEGVARAPTGEVEVRPDQRVLLDTRMDLTVRIGGGG